MAGREVGWCMAPAALIVRRSHKGARSSYTCFRPARSNSPRPEAHGSRGGMSTMLRLSSADHRVSPPIIDMPREYNAAHDLLERNLRAGRNAKLAYLDD